MFVHFNFLFENWPHGIVRVIATENTSNIELDDRMLY